MREIKKKSNSQVSTENPRSKYGIPRVSDCTRRLRITLETTNFFIIGPLFFTIKPLCLKLIARTFENTISQYIGKWIEMF
jgi:hypothetical protein